MPDNSATKRDIEPQAKTPEVKNGESLVDTARRFLKTNEVKNATPEAKAEFLRLKGLDEEQIKALLAEVTENAETKHNDAQLITTTTTNTAEAIPAEPKNKPIIPIQTFPEYTHPPEDPKPLISTQTILNTFYAFTGLSLLTHGTSKHIFEPLAAQTTEARTVYRHATSRNLSSLINLLESTVSALPEPLHNTEPLPALGNADVMSEVDDPAELFSRDMGTQTSYSRGTSPMPGYQKQTTYGGTPRSSSPNGLLAPPGIGMSGALVLTEPLVQTHLKKIARVAEMSEDLAELGDQETGIARDLWQEMTDFEHRIQNMKWTSEMGNSLGVYGQYGYTVGAHRRDDEVTKTKDTIRKMKGILLKPGNFPRTA